MTAAVERGMRLASVEFALDVIGQLSSEGVLKCSLEDAIKMFDFDSVTVVSSRSKASKKRESSKSVKKVSKITAKPTVILPFCGEIQGDWCKGVKFNHGLHTQCTNGPSGEDTYCKTCRKHADNSATGKPPYGDINDRAEFNVDYRDPKGKLTLPFANVVEKLSINLETANVAAATLGWTIPAEQLVKRSSKRGRPTKSAAVSDSDSDTEETPKKKRGRPSKAKVAAPTQEDQIAQLVAEAYAETKTTKPVIKVKKLKLTAEQKEQAKIAKKEAADKIKAEKKEAADKIKAEKKEAADKIKAEKKEAADKLKAEKKEAADKIKAEKAAAILAKKEAADKLKEEKLVAKALEKEAKEAAAAELKAEKKAIALKARQEKAAAKKAEREAAKLRKKEAADKLKAEKAETSDDSSPEDAIVFQELEEEVILEDSEIAELEVDSSDDEEEGETELSKTMTVGGVEYFFSEQDGQTILFSKNGEPVGLYDAETDTVQECEFDEE
jgi:hypothetical protein